MRKRLSVVLASVGLGVCGSSALAVDGSLSTPTGLIAGGNYLTAGVRVEWSVSQNPNFTWDYEYTFTRLSGAQLTPGLSHFILQLSLGIDFEEDLFNFAGPIDSIEFGTFGSDSGNPGLPAGQSIFGIKINTEDNDDATFSFTSTRQPMWGDVYGKGGSNSFFYNRDLGVTVANPNDYLGTPVSASGAPLFKALVPDTLIPAPGVGGVLALGGVLAARRRR